MTTYEYKQCPICRAWIGDDPHTCGGSDIKFGKVLMPDTSPMVQWHDFIDPETKDYLRRIAEALEKWVNLMTPNVKAPPERLPGTLGYHDVAKYYQDEPDDTP